MAITPGKGTTITVGGSSIAQILDITPPQVSNEPQEVTTLSDTWATFLATLPDGGEVTLTLLWDHDSATHATLWTMATDGSSATFVITLPAPSSTTYSFTGRVSGISGQQITAKNTVQANVTIKVSGAITATP